MIPIFDWFRKHNNNKCKYSVQDENENYRKMVMESIEKIMGGLGSADIDSRLEEQLIDGILYAFQEQTTEVIYRVSPKKHSKDLTLILNLLSVI